MSRKKVVLLVSSHVLILLIGLLLGFYLRLNSFVFMNEFSIISHYSNYVQSIKKYGSDENYRDSLIEYNKALYEVQKMKEGENSKFIEIGRTLNYLRLSLVEEKLGNHKDSKKYLDKSIENCNQKLKWQDCSRNYLINFMQKLDTKSHD